MSTAEMRFDPVRFKQSQRDNWNAISAGWLSAHEWFERGGAVVSARLLESAGVKPGQRILDVGTGIGEPALTAAGVVGPAGHVVGIDLAEDMIAVARKRAGGMGNVEFLVGDVESLEFPVESFDAVLARWSLMFVADRVAALRSVRGVLVPGGVLAAAVWGGPRSATPVLSLGFQALARRLDLPPAPAGQPGPFSMEDPEVVRADLVAAGFDEVAVSEYLVPFEFASAREYVVFNRLVAPPTLLARIAERFGSVDDPETWAEVGRAVESCQRPDGSVPLPSKVLLVRAVVPVG